MENGPRKILLVNDDGLDSERIFFAKEVLEQFGEVMVVTPHRPQSGTSMSISLKEVKYGSFNSFYHVVGGTPVDCVNVALFSRAFRYKPDIIVSGINKGYNLGIDTRYSGTVGAALQGIYFGYKSIAFSGDPTGIVNVKKYFQSTFEYVLDNDLLSTEYVLNVNFPADSFYHKAEIRKTNRYLFKSRIRTRTIRDKVEFKREIIEEDYPTNSDMYAHENGHISITRIWL